MAGLGGAEVNFGSGVCESIHGLDVLFIASRGGVIVFGCILQTVSHCTTLLCWLASCDEIVLKCTLGTK